MKSAKILTMLFLIAGCATEATEATDSNPESDSNADSDNNAGSLRVSWIISNFICNDTLTIKLGNNQAQAVPCESAGTYLYSTVDAGEYLLTVEYAPYYHGSHQIIRRNINILPANVQQESFIF